MDRSKYCLELLIGDSSYTQRVFNMLVANGWPEAKVDNEGIDTYICRISWSMDENGIVLRSSSEVAVAKFMREVRIAEAADFKVKFKA